MTIVPVPGDANDNDPIKKLLDWIVNVGINGFSVLPWTINSIKNLQEMIDMNVDGIISDNPKEMIDYIKQNKNK